MTNLLDKFIPHFKNLNFVSLGFKKLQKKTEVKKIFEAIEEFSKTSEIRYVGGCVRKIINNQEVEDIDLAVNLTPKEVCLALKKKKIKFYETGIKHGTITALIKKHKYEITSLRKDIETDGRHAKVEFSKDWYEDALRRDFTINAIYSDIKGNLYDPFDGKKDLESGEIKFIGDGDKRIKEDYLRILRYLRFFLEYSKKKHNPNTVSIIKKNLDGLSKISSERLIDEFKKLVKSKGLVKLYKDQFCLEIIILIFPQLKNINILNNIKEEDIKNVDFIILISLLIIDASDNTEYFLYKFNLSNYDKKRILFLKNFNLKPLNKNTFIKENLWKIFYINGKQSLYDVLNYQMLKSKKSKIKLLELSEFFKDKKPPLLPIKANFLINEYMLSEGKELGLKLKTIEEKWLNNNFKITENEIKKIILN
jgi:poly(A) polymerase|tara:strand:+ start:1803 stop:3068 length:1266 start_codon:yes stop_codon:yes gene_type:complete